ncbi:MAG: AAA family ATPase [Minisyncoccales bacterium]
MIIKRILLKNIRSYEEQEFVFPEGSTLLSGDIGSGKTSILLAIEFALFGLQPGQRGTSLLRNGTEEGKVVMDFEVDGNEITIERTLKKGKTVTQNYCYIDINGDKKELSVTELKSAVLDLLNYPSEFSKKQNLLYKFTVYTPQEEMKQIIIQDPETRINTLRHVFGIDKYKRILENVNIILSKIREEKRMKQGLTHNLEENKEKLVMKEEELQTKRYNLVSTEKELFSKQEGRKKIEEEKNEIQKRIDEKNRLQQEISKSNLMINNKKDSIASNNKTINQLQESIEELKKLEFDESQIDKIKKENEELKKEKEKLNEKSIELSSEINALNYKNKENQGIKEKLSRIEVCPTCLQDVNESYKQNVMKKTDENTEKNNKKINELNNEKTKIQEKIKEIDNNITEKEKELTDLNVKKIKIESISEKQQYIDNLNKTNESLKKDIEMLEKHLETLKSSVLEMQKYDNLFEEKNKKYQEALDKEKASEIKVAELKKEIEFVLKEIEELKNKIQKGEEVVSQMNYLSELENWLSKKFVPAIYMIEKNVMMRLKSEFSKLFEEWFCMLVSESFNAKLRDDFTPIIEQHDYEIDYSYLSGGERTAVALAYRLALNQVINSMLSKIKTKDIVILDEPTDGFSEQQLDKMRDVLLQLNARQMIIVSHEQKIEDFVENIIKLRKDEQGITVSSE